MIDRGKESILGVEVNVIDYDAAVERIISDARNKTGASVSALAVHGVMTGVFDPAQRYRINHLDLVVPDGQPVRWALNWLHRAGLVDRVRGPTLMFKVCERAAQEGLPVYLYGSTATVIAALVSSLRRRFPKLVIAGTQPSFFRRLTAEEKTQVAQQIRESAAALVFVGLGCPRQEVWAYEYRTELPMPIIAVGAAFDFLSGQTPQAPLFLQRLGLEWCYRLLHDPRRLWKRYLLLAPLYLGMVFLQACEFMRFDKNPLPPEGEVRYG